MANSSATVTLGPELQRHVDQLVRNVAGDVVAIVEAISNDIAEGARRQWYDNVTRRSGESGESNDYRLELRGTTVRGVIFNSATKNVSRKKRFPGMVRGATVKVNAPTAYAYFVRRPGPFSKTFKGLNLAEYSDLMRVWQETGALPPGYIARAMVDGKGRKRPVGVSKISENPKHADGKNVWKVLVIDRSKKLIEERLPDLDKALQASADKFSK